MGDNFFMYLDRMVLMGFFSGYPLIYLIIRTVGDNSWIRKYLNINISSLLPCSYALVGILYLGFLLENMYPDYSMENIKLTLQGPFLKLYGLFSILFFIPALNKRIVFSLIHSLVFFFFLVMDLYLHVIDSTGKEMLRNDMNIYTRSLLLHAAAFLFVAFVYVLYTRIKKN